MSPGTSEPLPARIDPAAPPPWLRRAAKVVLVAGLVSLALGAAAADAAGDGGRPPVDPMTWLYVWLLSLPLAAALAAAHAAVGRARLHRYERRAGFLPRPGRRALPASGRTTLYRLEYGSRDDRLCLMLAAWHHTATGWQRGSVREHVWVPADDPVRLGEERARLEAVAEELEEEMDDARLAGDGRRALRAEQETARRAVDRRSRALAEELARD